MVSREIFPTGKILVPFPLLHVGISNETSMCFEPIVNTTHWCAPVARGDKISHEASGGVRCGGFIRTISVASSHSTCGDAWWMRRDSAKCPASLMSEKEYSYRHMLLQRRPIPSVRRLPGETPTDQRLPMPLPSLYPYKSIATKSHVL